MSKSRGLFITRAKRETSCIFNAKKENFPIRLTTVKSVLHYAVIAYCRMMEARLSRVAAGRPGRKGLPPKHPEPQGSGAGAGLREKISQTVTKVESYHWSGAGEESPPGAGNCACPRFDREFFAFRKIRGFCLHKTRNPPLLKRKTQKNAMPAEQPDTADASLVRKVPEKG